MQFQRLSSETRIHFDTVSGKIVYIYLNHITSNISNDYQLKVLEPHLLFITVYMSKGQFVKLFKLQVIGVHLLQRNWYYIASVY